jgi:hypothetical protein
MRESVMSQRLLIVALTVLCALPMALGARPPRVLNYQGVLRDAAGSPLDGTYTMTFRLYNTATAGQSIIVNPYGAVEVVDGLFSVAIGSGPLADGDAPGHYTYLPSVFGDYTDLFLEIEIDGEVLAPRTPLASTGYAFSARYVNGVEIASADALDLYVDAAAGNDTFNGLFPWSPKQTIQAAVDRIPTVLGDDVVVHIAPGTYAETVRLYDRSFRGDSSITLLGEGGNVRITGDGVRENGIRIRNISGFVVEGLEVVDTLSYKVLATNSSGTLRSCLVTNTASMSGGSGLLISRSFVTVEDSTISDHTIGLVCTSASRCFVDNVSITGNYRGIDALKSGQVRFIGPATVTGNNIGCQAFGHGEIDFFFRSDVHVTGNTSYDLLARFLSTIFAYGNADVGACVAEDNSVCHTTRALD